MESKDNFFKRFKAGFSQRWLNHYVIAIRNDRHFKHRFSARLKGSELFSLFLLGLLLILGLSFLLFRFTPLNRAFNANKNVQKKEMVVINQRADSLDKALALNAAFYKKIRNVLRGDITVDSLPEISDSTYYKSIQVEEASNLELALRQKVENNDEFAFRNTGNISSAHMVRPIDGIVTDAFDSYSKHYGVDIAAPKGTPIKAILDGVVILSTWSENTGHTLGILHNNGMISMYKHNEKLLLEEGDLAEAGQAIALIGDTGEESSGYHLHFEIWHKNVAIDPSDYFDFNL